eukprot:273828-Chlamydomonas_euryale.AAC.12
MQSCPSSCLRSCVVHACEAATRHVCHNNEGRESLQSVETVRDAADESEYEVQRGSRRGGRRKDNGWKA